MSIIILPLKGIAEVCPGDDLGIVVGDAIDNCGYGIKAHDTLVVCQKIVSKAEGRVLNLGSVVVGARAKEFAAAYDKDERVVQVALDEAEEVLRMGDGHLITATAGGFIAANSGLDRSNQAAADDVTLLPLDSDKSAAQLRSKIKQRFAVDVGVIVSDTFGRPWRMGQVDVAIGAAGLEVLDNFEGRPDRSGRVLEHTLIATADQLAAAAGMAMGKADGIPAVIVRGARSQGGKGAARQLVRPRENDLFR